MQWNFCNEMQYLQRVGNEFPIYVENKAKLNFTWWWCLYILLERYKIIPLIKNCINVLMYRTREAISSSGKSQAGSAWQYVGSVPVNV